MINKKARNKFFKYTGIILGILVVLLAAFHFWFLAHAKELLEDLVESQSHGKLKMKVKKFRFGYFSKKMELDKAVFYNTDTATGTTAYRFSVDKINLKVYALWPIIFKKQFLIDSLTLGHPDIVITRLRAPDKDRPDKKDLSIPEEMGKVYHSIQDALEILEVRRFEIDDAKLTLINKVEPEEKPIVITNLFLHLDNFSLDTTKVNGRSKFLFGDNLVLRTRDQDILFPDGRHRLSFGHFRINMKKRVVEFNDCTVAATKSDSSSASFTVHFDALIMTNIDFDTLYQHEVIKADSVYCVNPQFKLDVELDKNPDKKKKPPRLDQIVQQLTGDMQLGFVIVNNASIDITTTKNGIPNTFTSDHNNFEIQGFTVDRDAPKPILVKSFAMAIRNYENFLNDSSYSVQFDSILFNDNRIRLSNFTLRQLNAGKINNSFSMPGFELRGLEWDDLVFNRHLSARAATLYRPIIDFTEIERRKKKQTFFQTLGVLGRAMDIDELDVVDGKIDLLFKDSLQLHLDHASLSVASKTLFASSRASTVWNSVNDLSFSHGLINTKGIKLEIEDAYYKGASADLTAGKVYLADRQKTISAFAQNVTIGGIVADDSTGRLGINGIRWEKADWKLDLPANKNNRNRQSFSLQNLQGSNTKVNLTDGSTSMNTLLKSVSFKNLHRQAEHSWQADDIFADGEDLKWSDASQTLSVGRYRLGNQVRSTFDNIRYDREDGVDSVSLRIPHFVGTPDIGAIMDGSININEVRISNPVAFINLGIHQANSKTVFPKITMNKLRIDQPQFIFNKNTKAGTIRMNWNADSTANDNFLEVEDLVTGRNPENKIVFSKMHLSLNHFAYSDRNGKLYNTGEGSIRAEMGNSKATMNDGHISDWSTTVDQLTMRNFFADSLGKNKGIFALHSLEIGDFTLNDSALKKPDMWLAGSSSIKLRQFTGKYQDSVNYFDWYNVNYSASRKSLTIDSFSYHPTPEHEAFVSNHPFQADDFRARTGKTTIDGIDAGAYLKDRILKIHSLKFEDALLDDSRDLRPPLKQGVQKPMPVQLIKKIPVKISADTVAFRNMNFTYAELNAKSNEVGTIGVSQLYVRLFPVRNYDLQPDDSLRIQATGHLMDSIWVRLRLRESYTDSLAGFFMSVRMKPTDMRVLNPVLIPLSSVKIQSGILDTLSMRVAGKETVAYGEMRMNYHDLHVKFLKNGNEMKKSFLSSLITFVANSFVIKNKNSSRVGRVFFIRLPDRSVMNYLTKITMSGVASSVGAKGNHKIFKKYKKELRERNLPPFDYD